MLKLWIDGCTVTSTQHRSEADNLNELRCENVIIMQILGTRPLQCEKHTNASFGYWDGDETDALIGFHRFYTEHWKWNHCHRQSVVKDILDHIRTRGKNPHMSKTNIALYTYYITCVLHMYMSCIPVTLGCSDGAWKFFFSFSASFRMYIDWVWWWLC